MGVSEGLDQIHVLAEEARLRAKVKEYANLPGRLSSRS